MNVDLLLKSRDDLTPIVESFGEDVIVLANDKVGDFYFAYFEIAGSHAGPNEDIGYFCALVESLDEQEKELWDNSFHRIFDIGYEAGDSGNSYASDLRHDVLSRISEFNASLRITIYPYVPKPKKH